MAPMWFSIFLKKHKVLFHNLDARCRQVLLKLSMWWVWLPSFSTARCRLVGKTVSHAVQKWLCKQCSDDRRSRLPECWHACASEIANMASQNLTGVAINPWPNPMILFYGVATACRTWSLHLWGCLLVWILPFLTMFKDLQSRQGLRPRI